MSSLKFLTQKNIDLSISCVHNFFFVYVQFTEETFVLRDGKEDLMQDRCVPHLGVLPRPGLPARDEPLEGEHQLRQLRDLSPLEKWQICVK